jgi:hypothetical protein
MSCGNLGFGRLRPAHHEHVTDDAQGAPYGFDDFQRIILVFQGTTHFSKFFWKPNRGLSGFANNRQSIKLKLQC